MSAQKTKKCPYCAEEIRAEAVKCRYCGSNLDKKNFNFDFLSSPGYWYREEEGKKVAGVCTGIAKQLDAPILLLPLRLFFILTTIFWAFGLILYIIMWILMPTKPVSPQEGKTSGSGSRDNHAKTSQPDIAPPESKVEDADFEELSISDDMPSGTPDGEGSKEAESVDEVEISESDIDEADETVQEKPNDNTKAEMTDLTRIAGAGFGVIFLFTIYIGVLKHFSGLSISPAQSFLSTAFIVGMFITSIVLIRKINSNPAIAVVRR